MPFVNYPQNVKRAEYDISFLLEGKMYAPKDISGQHVVAVVERELFYAPLVTLRPPNGGHHQQQSSVIVETLCFEKKGKKGKPAVELRATLNSLQVVPGTNLKLDISLKELTSSTWTKVVAHLFERTVCRDDADMALWSADCELANADLVRPSVYNFFLTDDIIGNGSGTSEKTKTANGESVTSTEQLIFHVPRIPCSPLSTEHLEFSHFLRIEVFLPGWLSSDRSVYTDVPVQLMTCDLSTAALLLNHQASIASIIDHRASSRSAETDNMSVISGRSSSNNSARPQSPQSTRSAAERSITMTAQSPSVTLSSLPPRYCDIHPADQRPAPTLVLLAKHAANDIIAYDAGSTSSMIDYHHQQPLPQRLSRQSQNSTTRHTTLSSVQSMEYKSLISGGLSIADDTGEERYRSRPLPMAPVPSSSSSSPGLDALPPLPTVPMPTLGATSVQLNGSRAILPLQIPHHAADDDQEVTTTTTTTTTTDLSTSQYGLIAGNPFSSMTSDTSSPGSFSRKHQQQRQNSAGSIGTGSGQPKTPTSPVFHNNNDSMNVGDGATSDDDAGYFKSSIARKSLEREKGSEKGLFRLRKNSSIKHTR
ncbi:hypothetical protein GGF42_001181 [Coemansia sp. RSA 2424]|nr:hypothetical protein GGF42_001181 [Coemansia sp. RSA 2424]